MTDDQVVMLLLILLGAAILNRITTISGPAGLLVNAMVLLAGAEAAHVLSTGLALPFDHMIERTIVVTLAGMLAAALLVLLLLGRHHDD